MKKANLMELMPFNKQEKNSDKFNSRNTSKKKKSWKHIFSQFVTAFLICCFLNTTIIAAPRWIVVSANEVYQDFRFDVLATGFFVNFPKWFAGIFATTLVSEETQQVTRIQICNHQSGRKNRIYGGRL